jgi:hypothetical protein
MLMKQPGQGYPIAPIVANTTEQIYIDLGTPQSGMYPLEQLSSGLFHEDIAGYLLFFYCEFVSVIDLLGGKNFHSTQKLGYLYGFRKKHFAAFDEVTKSTTFITS